MLLSIKRYRVSRDGEANVKIFHSPGFMVKSKGTLFVLWTLLKFFRFIVFYISLEYLAVPRASYLRLMFFILLSSTH